MFNTIFNKGSLPVLENLMYYTKARHKAIANNIANVDTPGYKALDVPTAEFERALLRAFEEQRKSPTGVFELAPARGVRPVPGGLELEYLESPDAGILKHNGNNVDLELEMGKSFKNGMLHNLAAGLLAQQFNLLREAVAGRIIA